MYLLLDNYDSFTHNVYQYMAESTREAIEVVRNDEITTEEIAAKDPRGIVISPGPGRPEDAGISVEVVRRFAGSIPILGICLGHQAIGVAFGASITGAKRIVHGKTEKMTLDGKGLFRAIPSGAEFTRYHSLVVDRSTLPEELEISANSADGEIMGVRHRLYPVEGIQFHPESMASALGKKLFKNFFSYRRDPFQVKDILLTVLSGNDLTRSEAEEFMEELTEGNLTPSQIAGFLVALNSKGITPEEIAGCAAVLRRKRVHLHSSRPVLDIVGTGGDGLGTFNISSLAAVAAASCGAVVAKHGNRAVSSLSGSADFYRAVGIDIDITPRAAEKLLGDTDFSFLFAPIYHGAMKHAAVPRRELGVKTIMNLLGPLVNPAGAEYQLIGVYDEALLKTVAEAAVLLGIKRGMVVYGSDGLDELTVTGPTKAVLFNRAEGTPSGVGPQFEEIIIRPEELGIKTYPLRSLLGGTAEENARTAAALLEGRGNEALLDAVSLNAGAGLFIYGIAESIGEGYRMARDAFRTGKVKRKLEEIAEASQAVSVGV
jgi:anthranilate synthase/phosphoribosyltransferase